MPPKASSQQRRSRKKGTGKSPSQGQAGRNHQPGARAPGRQIGVAKSKRTGAQMTAANSMISSIAGSREFLRNMMDPKTQFLIPRLVPTEASPNFYRTVITLPVVSEQGWFVGMIQPSIQTPLAYLTTVNEGVAFTGRKLESYHHVDYDVQPFDWDNELVSQSGTRLAPVTMANGLHYGENRQRLVPGGKAYPGKFNAIASNSAGFEIRNNSGRSLVVRSRLYPVNDAFERIANLPGDQVTIAAGAVGRAPFAAYDPTTYEAATHMCLSVDIVHAQDDKGEFNLDIGVYGDLTVGQTYAWARAPFFTGSDAIQILQHYFEAEGVSTTGFSALVSNHAAPIYRGGSIKAAKLTGGSRKELPMDPSAIGNFLSKQKGKDVLPNGQLKDGLFWSYSAEKIQDLMFRQVPDTENSFLYGDKTLPYLCFFCKWSSTEQAPVLQLEASINLEYLTNSLIVPKYLSPVDSSRFMELWLSLGSQHCRITENPQHLKDVARWTKDVVTRTLTNKDFQRAAKIFGQVAGTALMAAI